MDTELFNEIKKAEEEAEKIVRKAEQEKGGIIERTKKDALKLYDSRIEELNKKRDKLLNEGKNKIMDKRNDILKKTDLVEIKQRYRSNIDKAVNYVLTKVKDL